MNNDTSKDGMHSAPVETPNDSNTEEVQPERVDWKSAEAKLEYRQWFHQRSWHLPSIDTVEGPFAILEQSDIEVRIRNSDNWIIALSPDQFTNWFVPVPTKRMSGGAV